MSDAPKYIMQTCSRDKLYMVCRKIFNNGTWTTYATIAECNDKSVAEFFIHCLHLEPKDEETKRMIKAVDAELKEQSSREHQ